MPDQTINPAHQILTFELIDAGRIPEVMAMNFSVLTPMWHADSSDEARQEIALRNERFAAELEIDIPGLTGQPRTADTNDWEQVDGEDLSPEVVYQRYKRSRLLGLLRDNGALRQISIQLCDGATEIVVTSDGLHGDQSALIAELDALIGTIVRITGMTPWDGERRKTVPIQGCAAAVLTRRQATLGRVMRVSRRVQLEARLGPYAAAVLTLIAFAGIAAVLTRGLREGGLQSAAARATPAIFTTRTALPQTRNWFAVPRFELIGTVDGRAHDVTLRVYRDEYIRAAPGARYTVVATGDASEPWVLRQNLGGAGSLIPLGGGNAIPIGALFICAAGLGLWGWLVAMPILRRDKRRPNGVWINMSRGLRFLFQVGLFLAVVFLGRQLLLNAGWL